jgi:hypothetical protein
MKFVITVGSGNSGGGLIHDYLSGRDDFVSPFYNQEFRFLNDPSGLFSLHKNLYENFSVNNSAKAFDDFYNFTKFQQNRSFYTNGKKKRMYSENFLQTVENFIKDITDVKYSGSPNFKRLEFSFFKKIEFYIFNKFFHSNRDSLFFMRLSCKEKKFLQLSKKLILDLVAINLGTRLIKKKILLDQAVSFWDPMNSFKFFDNLKIILVNRDPRAIFYSMKSRKSLPYPGQSVKIFVDWYLIVRNNQKKFDKKKILEFSYEDFIINFDKNNKKLCKFLNLNQKKPSKFNPKDSAKNIFKAKEFLERNELKYIEKKCSKYLQW